MVLFRRTAANPRARGEIILGGLVVEMKQGTVTLKNCT